MKNDGADKPCWSRRSQPELKDAGGMWPATLLELPHYHLRQIVDPRDFANVCAEIADDFSLDMVPHLAETVTWHRVPAIAEFAVYVRLDAETRAWCASRMLRHPQSDGGLARFDYAEHRFAFGKTRQQAVAFLLAAIAH